LFTAKRLWMLSLIVAGGCAGLGRPPAFSRADLDSAPMEGRPKLRRFVQPEYPASAREERIGGIVRVRIVVSEVGTVSSAEVVHDSDTEEFDEYYDSMLERWVSVQDEMEQASLDAVMKWTFVPAMVDGQFVESTVVLPLEFDFGDRPPN
jgi:periplasmic protein TonB